MLIRADSREYIQASITCDHDITGRAIDVALPWTGYPPTTWYRTDVVSVVDSGHGSWTAIYRILVGPNGQVELPGGDYDWYVRVLDNPEQPVRQVGILAVRG